MLEKVSFDDPDSLRMTFHLTGRCCKSPNNLILDGGDGIRFPKFQTFDEDDEQDSDSQEVPTICSASRTTHSTCTLVVFTTFLPGIRMMNLSQVTETGGHRDDSATTFQRQKFRENEDNADPDDNNEPPTTTWQRQQVAHNNT